MVVHVCNLRLLGAWVRKGIRRDVPGLPRELKNSLGRLFQTIKKATLSIWLGGGGGGGGRCGSLIG